MVNKSAIRACKCERVLKVCPPQPHTYIHTWCAQRVISLITSYAHSQGSDLGNSAAHFAWWKTQNSLKFKLKHARTSIWFTNLSANTCSDNCKTLQIQIMSLWRGGEGRRAFNSYAPNRNLHTSTIFTHNYCLLHCSNLQFRIEDLECINNIRQRHSAHILYRCFALFTALCKWNYYICMQNFS